MVGVTRAYIGYLYLDDRYPYGRHRLQYIQFHLTWNGRGWNVYYELREGASERVRERMGGLTRKNGLSLSRAGRLSMRKQDYLV